MAGKIDIESDADMTGALENFVEELLLNSPRKEYLVLHAKDTVLSVTKISDSDIEAEIQTPNNRRDT